MEGYGVGMMARSLAGHDKGKVYMVLDVKEPFVYLVDGKIRTLDHPKKKRIKHVQVDRHIPEWIQNVIREGRRSSGFGCHPWKKRIRRKVKTGGKQCLRQMLLK